MVEINNTDSTTATYDRECCALCCQNHYDCTCSRTFYINAYSEDEVVPIFDEDNQKKGRRKGQRNFHEKSYY